ncbi:symporter [Aureococcus anophagefferens]|nr:symporter [Aureococcus anophagefferens]
MRKAVKRIGVHARCQALSLVAVPGAYYAVVHRRGLDAAVLGPAVARGLMVCLSMPATTATGVVFAGAGGDASVAAVNAALGNLLGPVVSPATVAFLVGTSPASAGEAPLAAKVGALFLVIALPFATGGLAQAKLGRAAPRVRAAAAKATKVVLCFLFYFLFCTVFAPFGPRFDPAALALAVFVLATHVTLLALCWAACRDLAVQDRIAVSLMASQKTESRPRRC